MNTIINIMDNKYAFGIVAVLCATAIYIIVIGQ